MRLLSYIVFVCIYVNITQLIMAQGHVTKTINIEDGLSQGFVSSLIQASDDFIWMSTKAGLNRYDGTKIVVFTHQDEDVYSPASNSYAYLFEDHRDWMWIVYDNLKSILADVYDPKTGRFYHIDIPLEQRIIHQSIIEDPLGHIWLGGVRISVNDDLLNNVDSKGHIDVDYKEVWHVGKQYIGIANFGLLTRDSSYYLISRHSLYKIDWQTLSHEFIFEAPPVANPSTVKSMYECEDGRILVNLGKCYILNKDESLTLIEKEGPNSHFLDVNGHILSIANTISQVDALSPNGKFFESKVSFSSEINQLYNRPVVDRSGMIWMPTRGYGVQQMNLNKNRFKSMAPNNSVRSILIDSEGDIWRMNKEKNFYTHKAGKEKVITSLKWGEILESSDGQLWVSNSKKGKLHLYRISKIDYLPEKVLTIDKYFNHSFECRNAHIYDEGIWLMGSKEIVRYDIHTHTTKHYIISNNIEDQEVKKVIVTSFIVEDKVIWAASRDGLFRYDLRDGKAQLTRFYSNKTGQNNQLKNHRILDLCFDPIRPNLVLWIGTDGNGLSRLDIDSGTFTHFTKKDGLPNDVVYSILPGSEDDLWLSTNYGLSKYNIGEEEFVNFTTQDGLPDNEYNTSSSYKAKDGTLLFGGTNGITYFHPDSLQLNDHVPKVVVSKIKINSKEVILDKSGEGKQKNDEIVHVNVPINLLKTLHLQYFQNLISIDYAALDYVNPDQNKYRIKMDGVDEDWIYAENQTTIQYANMSPGKYTFKVMGSNNDGLWSTTPASLDIIIRPPWWLSNMAYGAYFLLIIGSIYWTYKFQLNRAKLHNQLAFEQKEAVRLLELDKTKSDFFTNITHEFRTPITLILEPIRQILKQKLGDNIRKNLIVAKNNSETLLLLVNQLLDLSKIESGMMKTEYQRGNLLHTIKKNYNTLVPLAEKKGLSIKMTGIQTINDSHFDGIMLGHVITNLLSNAIKFTESGSVELNVDIDSNTDKKHHIISVLDSGKGISENDLPKIFQRFYQAENTMTKTVQGTGIGLALAKELAQLMDGIISVESKLGEGSTFKVILPISNEESHSTVLELENDSGIHLANQASEGFQSTQTIHTNRPLVLVVEDNEELNIFISESVGKEYEVISARNGEKGCQLAKEHIPDLVVTDLMMPIKNGYELCDELKNNELTAHIPIIILTAKTNVRSKIEGWETGADAYITKPFHTEELLARIKALIKGREKLQQIFQSGSIRGAIKSNNAQLRKLDQDFLEKVSDLIQQNISNPDLSVSWLSQNIYLSRTQLFRKIKAITGFSPNEFIRYHRLDIAKELLDQNDVTVGHVASEVGFTSDKYFSRIFREKFGYSPYEKAMEC
ncbi:MAG: ATP-binding protein [Saprospiraceae bacterium]